MKKINIFGVTGSIGHSTLDVLKFHSSCSEIKINALSAYDNVELLAKYSKSHNAKFAIIGNLSKFTELKDALFGTEVTPLAGTKCLTDVAALEADWTMNAIVGFAGLEVSIASAQSSKVLALANKESFVCGGDLLNATIKKFNNVLLPVDSEHSAVFQCLKNEDMSSLRKIILTASGGPFRNWSINKIKKATLEESVVHPNWTMGTKISIDSATMFNKALEVIEAKYLFDLPINKIDVLVHPESIVHSMVSFTDGSVIAHLGVPDMRGAIGYAFNYPKRCPLPIKHLELEQIGSLNFEAVDKRKFPSIDLAYNCIERGPLFGSVLNATKEVALDKFIAGEIKFLDITLMVKKVLESKEVKYFENKCADNFEDIKQADFLARDLARTLTFN